MYGQWNTRTQQFSLYQESIVQILEESRFSSTKYSIYVLHMYLTLILKTSDGFDLLFRCNFVPRIKHEIPCMMLFICSSEQNTRAKRKKNIVTKSNQTAQSLCMQRASPKWIRQFAYEFYHSTWFSLHLWVIDHMYI